MIAYEQFQLIEETYNNGWNYSTISVSIEPGDWDGGDGFVQTPDGSWADLDWKIGEGELRIISGPYKSERHLFSFTEYVELSTIQEF